MMPERVQFRVSTKLFSKIFQNLKKIRKKLNDEHIIDSIRLRFGYLADVFVVLQRLRETNENSNVTVGSLVNASMANLNISSHLESVKYSVH